jgi:hypothetical protein
MSRKSPSVRLAQFFVVVFALALVPVAFAAKGGGGGGGSTTTSATLTLTPTSVASGSSFQGAGCGYTTGQQANLVVTSPSARMFYPVGVDSHGCVSFGAWTSEAGQYTVAIYQGGHKQTLMASAPLTVY